MASQCRIAASALVPSPAASRRLHRVDVTPAFVEQRLAAAGQRPLQHPSVHRMRHFAERAVALQVADDEARGLRRQQRHPRDVGARQSRIGLQHRQYGELRRRHLQIGQRPVQRQPGRGLGLPQEIAEMAVFRRACRSPGAAAGRRRDPDLRPVACDRIFWPIAAFSISAVFRLGAISPGAPNLAARYKCSYNISGY